MAIDTIKSTAIADDAVTGAKIENNPTIAGNLGVNGVTTSTGTMVASSNLLVGSSSAVGNGAANELELTNPAGSGTVGMTLNVNSGSANTGNIYWRSSSSNNNVQIAGDPVTNYLAFTTAGNERMRIDTAGHITSASQSSAQSRPAAQITDVTGDASTYYSDTGNGGSGTTTYNDVFDQNGDMLNGAFTAPVTGKYLVCINVELDDVQANHSSGVFYIITSNRNYQRLFQPRNMSNVGVNIGLPMSQIVDADANDVIRWALYVAGNPKSINVNTNTNFGVHLLA